MNRLANNVWRSDGGSLYLTFAKAKYEGRENDDSDLYYVPISSLRIPSEVLDWLAQLNEKSWMTDKILADFVRAVDIVVGLR